MPDWLLVKTEVHCIQFLMSKNQRKNWNLEFFSDFELCQFEGTVPQNVKGRNNG